jgi:hypothetical protein
VKESIALWSEAAVVRGAEDMRILYPKSRSRNRLVLKGKSMTKAKVLAEFEAAKILDHLAPDWPLLLDDGAIIDHILAVVNRPLRPYRKHEKLP